MKSHALALSCAMSLLAAPALAQTVAKPAEKPAEKPVARAAAAPAAAAGAAAAKPRPKRSAADEARRAQTLATFEGGALTVGELEDAIERQSPMMRARYTDPNNLKELYDKTLRFAMLSVEAERRGFGKSDSVVQAVKQNAVQALMKADFDEEKEGLSVSKEDVKKYYDEHLDEYVQSALQRASILVVATEADAKALLEQAKAADLRAFRQLVREKSVDEKTKGRGGDVRYFDQAGKVRDEAGETVPPAVARAAFALKNVGDTAPAPIKVPGGFAIVKLTGSRPALSRKYAEAEETIRVRLWRERRQKAIEDFVAKIKAEHSPEVHVELANAIELDELPAGHETGKPGDDGEDKVAPESDEPEAKP